jgi:hypothetical protein
MATKKKRVGDELTEEQREKLLTGRDWFELAFDQEGQEREAWFENREELLHYWSQDPSNAPPGAPRPGGPGTRPWAWWKYESKGPRRRTAGSGTAAQDPRQEYTFGMPRYWSSYSMNDPPAFEAEHEFLKRWGLLTREEEEALTHERPDKDEAV